MEHALGGEIASPKRRMPAGRALIAVLAIALLAVAFQATGGRASVAQADYCNPNGAGFSCYWTGLELAPETRRFFQAAVTLRNWYWEEVADAYGGSVWHKCANILAGSNGAVAQVACGPNQPGEWVPAGYSPGYVFLVHSASGPRTILGAATQ